jgi:hypothetical protein
MLINLAGPEIRRSRVEAKEARLKEWHRYFALMPRRINDQQIAWLQFIERKGEKYKGMCYPPEMRPHPCWKWRWEYRLTGEENANRD